MLVLVLLSMASAQLVANDQCVGAKNVTDGALQVGNNYGVPVPDYSQRQAELYKSDVYYVYSATCVGKVTFAAAPDSTSTYLYIAAFKGSSCAGLGEAIRDYGYYDSSVEVYASAVGDKIYFGVGSYEAPANSTYGGFKFNITCSAQPVAAGDSCPHAILYTGPVLNVSTTNAFDERQSIGSYCSGPDIFIRYNATCDGEATVTSAASGSYNYIAVFYPGNCDEIVGSDWQRTCETSSGSTSFPVRLNQWYYLSVGGGTASDYSVSITCAANARPVNDECQGALPVPSSVFTYDASTALRSVPPDACDSWYNDVWYTYNATCNGDLVIQFNRSAYAVAYLGSSCGAHVLASDCLESDYVLSFPVTTGQTYTLVLGTGSSEPIEANLTCVAQTRPANDKCTTPTAIGTNTSTWFDARLATTDSYVRTLSCDRNLVHDVFFLYEACAGTNYVSLTTNESIYYLEVAAFLACGLEPVACKSDYSYTAISFFTPVKFNITIGLGFANPNGFVQVNFTCMPLPGTDAPTAQPTTQPTAAPSRAPTAPTSPTTSTPTSAPTSDDTNTTDTAAPTLSGATALQFGVASLLGLAMLA